MIEKADQALYYSKENGRNQVNQWRKIKDRLEKDNSTPDNLDNVTDILTGRPGFINLLNRAINHSGREMAIYQGRNI